MRFTQLIDRESGNVLWNALRPRDKVPIVSFRFPLHCRRQPMPTIRSVSYLTTPCSPICMFSCPTFCKCTSDRFIFPTLLLCCPLASPYRFSFQMCKALHQEITHRKAYCSFPSFLHILLSMQALIPGTMSELQLPDIT